MLRDTWFDKPYNSELIPLSVISLVVFRPVQTEDRCMSLAREKNELQSQVEENEEDMAELLKKYKAAVQQVLKRRWEGGDCGVKWKQNDL